MEMNKNQLEIRLPICEIKDWPSFKHRGMLCTVVGTFDKEVIKNTLICWPIIK